MSKILYILVTICVLSWRQTMGDDFVECLISANRDNIDSELEYIDPISGSVLTIPDKLTEDLSSIRVQCKKTSQTFTNKIRLTLDDTGKDVIDAKNYITVTCGSGTLSPAILTAQTSWCSTGCPLLPTDPSTNWKVVYPFPLLSTLETAAPVLQNSELEVSVTCRTGSAPANGGSTAVTTKCTNSGYNPNLRELITCVPGCTDLPKTGNVSASPAASTTSGAAPYNIGDIVVLSCAQSGYKVSTTDQITCLSTQRWNDARIPVCVPAMTGSSAIRASALASVNVVFVLVMIMCSFGYQ